VLHSLSPLEFQAHLALLSANCFGSGSSNAQTFYLLGSFGTALSKEKHESLRPLFVFIVSQALKHSQDLSVNSLHALGLFVDSLLREKSWMVSQYMLELILAFVAKVSLDTLVHRHGYDVEDNRSRLYLQLTRTCSSVLLFHRHRINGRYHLVLRALISLLGCLTVKSEWNCSGISSALAYSRLIGNLCEPPVQSIREKGGKSNLTSSATLTKKALARHLPVFLANYIYASLNEGFTSEVSESLKPEIYNVFAVLGTEGVKVTSGMVDSSGRAYLKILYEDYTKNGKWQA
jgi:nucleolar pre-ribosomal-associated protein 2